MGKNIIIDVLAKWDGISAGLKALVGLDGFIDKIQHPVESQNISETTFFPSLNDFGGHIKAASGKSSQVELTTQKIKPGGNAPIMANCLAHLGVTNTCIGTFGYPDIDPVFLEVHPDCQLISVGKAAETNALEFDDGKLILSELSTFYHLDWEKVKEQSDIRKLRKQAAVARLIALVDWCNLPHATNIWKGFLQEIIKDNLPSKPLFFFDLADLSKKSDKEISQVVQLMGEFKNYGKVTLGLNENEALTLSDSIGRSKESGISNSNLRSVGHFIFTEMTIDQLIIHPLDSCYVFTRDKSYHMPGRVVQKPLVSTGGGDNFNAGFNFGELNKFSTEESMVLAMATSGAYVQNGHSPSLGQLQEYLENWKNEY